VVPVIIRIVQVQVCCALCARSKNICEYHSRNPALFFVGLLKETDYYKHCVTSDVELRKVLFCRLFCVGVADCQTVEC
jgi:hypothetical protein